MNATVSNEAKQPEQTGRRIIRAALVGVTIAVLILALIAGVVGMGIPNRRAVLTMRSMTRLNDLAKAVALYQHLNEGLLPDVEAWPDQLRPFMPALNDASDPYESPFYPGKGRAYAMNASLQGRHRDDITDSAGMVLMFEIAPGGPAAGGPELLSDLLPHHTGHLVVFLDGHTQIVPPKELSKLAWKPQTKSPP